MIHPTAIIHPKAKLNPTVEVGPYAVIDEGVEVGAQCVIGPHVHLTGLTRIGKHNRFHAGCVIGDAPQDLKYKGEKTTLTVGDNTVIRECATLHLGTELGGGETVVGGDNLIMAYVGEHVLGMPRSY